jgi:hypothetical protein
MDSWGYSNGTPTTAAYTIQQVASVFSGFNKELKLTVTAAQTSVSSTTFNIIQNIEGFRIARLAPGTASAQFVTVAFWVKSSIAGTMPVYVCNSNITSIVQGNVTITSANVAQYVSTTVQVPTSGTWLTNNGLGMIVLIRPTITTFNIAATVGNTFEITGLVVLPGSLAPTAAQSALITRPYDEELRTCQRYFEWCPFNTFFYAYAASEIMETTVRFSADKRAVPTLSAVAADPSATTLISNMSTTVAQRVSLIGCAVSATATTATTAFAVGYRFSADARL